MPDTTFRGCMPALMTPCDEQRRPDFGALVRKGQDLIEAGMSAVVYCGSMGDWPLLTDEDRQEGVARLAAAGIPTVVGTGAANTRAAVAHAAHAARVGARGLMLIPRVLSRRSSEAAQEAHFKAILDAAPALPAVIYNSPYYGFVTRAGLFFRLREAHPNLVGFKEFSGAADLTYAAEHITSGIDELTLMVGVDTTVFHGYVIAEQPEPSPVSGMPCPRRCCISSACVRRRLMATLGRGARRRSLRGVAQLFWRLRFLAPLSWKARPTTAG